MPTDLQNKTIIITGGGTGIGAATALLAAKQNMNVAIAGRRAEPLNNIAGQIPSVLTVTCDVTNPGDLDNLVNQTLDKFGSLHAVFANAGYGLYASVEKTTTAAMRDIFETNFYGTLHLIQKTLPYLQSQNAGHILICSSALSEIPLPMYSAYCATKSAQKSITGALRAELSNTHINVTSVHPISTKTEFSSQVLGEVKSSKDGFDTPDWFIQSADHVARKIIRCLKKPCPEVWPSISTRLLLSFANAYPPFAAWALKRIYQRSKK